VVEVILISEPELLVCLFVRQLVPLTGHECRDAKCSGTRRGNSTVFSASSKGSSCQAPFVCLVYFRQNSLLSTRLCDFARAQYCEMGSQMTGLGMESQVLDKGLEGGEQILSGLLLLDCLDVC
jgi:hypothetical protein